MRVPKRLEDRRQLRQLRETAERIGVRTRQRDPEVNARLRLPDHEHVRWPACWTAEVYLPSHLPGLIAALARLRWDASGDAPSQRSDVLAWVRGSRERLSSHGSWLYVEHGAARPKPPAGVSHVHVGFFAIATSLIIVSARFALDAGADAEIEQVLRADARTEVVQVPGAHEIREVEQVKRLRVQTARDARHRACAAWLRKALPGVFASGEPPALPYPRADLLLTEEPMPFAPVNGQPQRGWPALLGLDRPFDAWVSAPAQRGGLRMATPDVREPPEQLTLAGRRADLLAGNGAAPLHNAELLGHVEESVAALLTRWALHAVVAEENRQLSALPEVGRGSRRRPRSTIRAIERMRGELLPLSRDVQALMRDLEWITKDPWRFEYGVLDLYAADGSFPRLAASRASARPPAAPPPTPFGLPAVQRIARRIAGAVRRGSERAGPGADAATPGPDAEYGNEELHFSSLLRADLRRRGELLAGNEQRIAQGLLVDSQLASTAANLRLQRVVMLIAVLAGDARRGVAVGRRRRRRPAWRPGEKSAGDECTHAIAVRFCCTGADGRRAVALTVTDAMSLRASGRRLRRFAGGSAWLAESSQDSR